MAIGISNLVNDDDPDKALTRRIADLERQVRELAAARTLQNSTISQGNLNISGGSLNVYDAAGNLRISLGQDGLHQYDTAGNQVLLLGTQSNGNDGLGIYNGATLEVLLGQLSSSPSIYGLGVLPFGGTVLQQVGGWLSTSGLAASSGNTSGVLTNFPASPSPVITAVVGPSGKVLLGGSFTIDMGGTNAGASVTINIDSGANFVEVASAQVNVSGVRVTGGSNFLWGSLTPGTHTFRAQYSVTGPAGTAVDFGGDIYVQPL